MLQGLNKRNLEFMSFDLLVLYSDRAETGGENRYIVLACVSFFDFPRKNFVTLTTSSEKTRPSLMLKKNEKKRTFFCKVAKYQHQTHTTFELNALKGQHQGNSIDFWTFFLG